MDPVQKTQTTSLVIEDDDQAAKLLAKFLELEGLIVHRAANGQQALDWLGGHHPDLITLDIQLPDMDGWTVLNQIKKMPQVGTIPVIIVSIMDAARKGFELGASQVLQKPVSRSDLKDALESVGLGHANGNENKHHKILVVDDDPFALELMGTILRNYGYQVSTAASGDECIKQATSEPPAAILLDLIMPDVSGFEVVQMLRAAPTTAMIPIIIITAKVLTKEDKQILSGHVQGILEKSSSRHEAMVEEIQRVLRRRK